MTVGRLVHWCRVNGYILGVSFHIFTYYISRNFQPFFLNTFMVTYTEP